MPCRLSMMVWRGLSILCQSHGWKEDLGRTASDRGEIVADCYKRGKIGSDWVFIIHYRSQLDCWARSWVILARFSERCSADVHTDEYATTRGYTCTIREPTLSRPAASLTHPSCLWCVNSFKHRKEKIISRFLPIIFENHFLVYCCWQRQGVLGNHLPQFQTPERPSRKLSNYHVLPTTYE